MRVLTELQKRVETLREKADAALEALREEAERRRAREERCRNGGVMV